MASGDAHYYISPASHSFGIILSDQPTHIAEGSKRVFQLRYVGERFTGARLPVSVLSDLSAFRDILAAFAKKRWFEAHATRKRLPKGFDQTLSFDLLEISEGSAVPKIAWEYQESEPVLPGFKDEILSIVDNAYTDVIRLFEQANSGLVPHALSPDHIKALNKFGSGLKDSERIEFIDSPNNKDNVVYLNTELRKSLITRLRETYESRIEGIGKLKGTHGDGKIYIYTEKFGEIKLEIDRDRVKNEFDGNIGSPVQYRITVELDHEDKLVSVRETHEVDLTDPDPLVKCFERLESMRLLPSGWYDGAGQKISHQAISSARSFIERRPTLAHFYSVFPDPDGGVLIELVKNEWDCTVEFDLDGKCQIIAIQLNGDEEFTSEICDVSSADLLADFDRILGIE